MAGWTVLLTGGRAISSPPLELRDNENPHVREFFAEEYAPQPGCAEAKP